MSQRDSRSRPNLAFVTLRDLQHQPGRHERTLARLDRLTGGSEGNLAATLENLRDISADLRELTENAKRYPSNLLFGEPPSPLERGR